MKKELQMSAKVFIAVYKPHPGCEEKLRTLVAQHYPALRGLGLVTERDNWVMKAEDGTLIEIGEWQNDDAADRAHRAPQIENLWNAMAKVASFETLASLVEASKLFPHFDPVQF